MNTIIHTIRFALKETFKNKNYIILFSAAFLLMLVLFALIPAWTVPGNTITTQLGIFTLRDYAVLVLLSGLYAVFIAMQVYSIRLKKKIRDMGAAVGGGLGALFAGIAGTAFCASCLAPFFALFGIGLGGVLFVLEYRLYFVIGIVVLILIAIYLTAKNIGRNCDSC